MADPKRADIERMSAQPEEANPRYVCPYCGGTYRLSPAATYDEAVCPRCRRGPSTERK